MEKSLKNKVDELSCMIGNLQYIKDLKSSSSAIISRYDSLDEIKKNSESYLVVTFKNSLEEANELSTILGDIFKRELTI